MREMANTAILTAIVAASLSAGGARADVVISSGATQNMSCAGGICAPTSTNAVLNVGDLETLLASGNVTVLTTGSTVQADNIQVDTALSWPGAAALTLDAHNSIAIAEAISVAGQGGVSLVTDDGGKGGTLSFGDKGKISFANLSSALAINGTAYMLVSSVKTLAAAVANNPAGDYALASNYNASGDGTYNAAPVPTTLTGSVEGLGNAISRLSVAVTGDDALVGLFSEVGAGGAVNDLRLVRVRLDMNSRTAGAAGGIAAENYGNLSGDSVTGKINGTSGSKNGLVGGLAGLSYGTINNSHASASVLGKSLIAGGLAGSLQSPGTINNSYATGNVYIKGALGTAGGLAGGSAGSISGCFATGNVRGGGGDQDRGNYAGLVGLGGGPGTISNSYSTGSVTQTGRGGGVVGGFVGSDNYGGHYGGSINDSYSTGAVAGPNYVGGFAGAAGNSGDGTNDYWDTTTSGTDQGVGLGPSAGISGLTTKQLRSGLPAGFNPKIWAEKRNINNGLPYLLANPPPK